MSVLFRKEFWKLLLFAQINSFLDKIFCVPATENQSKLTEDKAEAYSELCQTSKVERSTKNEVFH